MRKINSLKYSVALTILLLGSASIAKDFNLPQQQIVDFVNSSIESTINGMQSSSSQTDGARTWEMSRMFIRFQAIMGIGIKFFTNFQVVPEVELAIQKVK